jgi:hypothetical protein
MSLPTELHCLIVSENFKIYVCFSEEFYIKEKLKIKNLIYPDALSLKHTNRHFYSCVYTGVNLKIEWLIERRRLDLERPYDKGCELGSDMRFCRGSVRYVYIHF